MAWLLQRRLLGVLNHRLPVYSSKYVGQQSLRLRQRASLSRGSLCCIQRVKSSSLAVDSCCKELVLSKGIDIGHRSFHTTQPRRALPPVLAVILRPVIYAASVITGRMFRKWWKKSSKEEKAKVIDLVFNKNRKKLLVTLGVMVLGSVIYYMKHLETDPLTHRTRFIIFTHEEMKQYASYRTEDIKEEFINKMLPNDHPLCRQVGRVMNRIMTANREEILKTGINAWTTYVIDAPHTRNAMVVPDGSVFVFSGISKICETDDQLGCVLSHEIAHIILNHHGETMSEGNILAVLNAVIIASVWAILPDLAALLAQITGLAAAAVLFHLPYSRLKEHEADLVGVLLAAKACIDVRETSVFWSKMKAMTEMEKLVMPPEFLSTHPNSDNRRTLLDELIPEAISLRERCKCPRLNQVDPRDSFESWRKRLELEYQQKKVETVVKIS